MHVNKLIPNLVQSKSFSFRDPKSQSPEADAKLFTRLKKLNSIVLVFIPIINGNKRYVNCLCPFFPFAQ